MYNAGDPVEKSSPLTVTLEIFNHFCALVR